MKSITPFSVLLFLISCNPVAPTFTDYNSVYFPLSVGNTWTYTTNKDDTSSVYRIQYTIFDKKVINGCCYYYYGQMNGKDTILVRADSVGNIVLREGDKDYCYYNFSMPDSTEYLFKAYCSRPDSLDAYTVLSRNNVFQATSIGDFNNCKDLYFDVRPYWINDNTIAHSIDEEYSVTFAPNIGIVSRDRCQIGLWIVSYSIHSD